MASHNPYAPSAASMKRSPPSGVVSDETQVWRDGSTVVMNLSASMPRRCIRCNEPSADPTRSRKVYWHHPAIYIFVFGYVLLYVIIAAIFRKSATVDPGLCAKHKKQRFFVILLSWVGVILGFVASFGGIGTDYSDAMLITGMLLFLASIIAGMILGRLVYAKKIDSEVVRLGGCKNAFLESLPEYPGA